MVNPSAFGVNQIYARRRLAASAATREPDEAELHGIVAVNDHGAEHHIGVVGEGISHRLLPLRSDASESPRSSGRGARDNST